MCGRLRRFFHPGRLDRLASFGLLPGTAIRVHQTWPSVVVALDGTELAYDRETSRDIFVRRSGAGEEVPARRAHHER